MSGAIARQAKIAQRCEEAKSGDAIVRRASGVKRSEAKRSEVERSEAMQAKSSYVAAMRSKRSVEVVLGP